MTKFTVLYGAIFEYESPIMQASSHEEAKAIAEAWLQKDSGYPLDLWGFSINLI